jgi:hypothetical protein
MNGAGLRALRPCGLAALPPCRLAALPPCRLAALDLLDTDLPGKLLEEANSLA